MNSSRQRTGTLFSPKTVVTNLQAWFINEEIEITADTRKEIPSTINQAELLARLKQLLTNVHARNISKQQRNELHDDKNHLHLLAICSDDMNFINQTINTDEEKNSWLLCAISAGCVNFPMEVCKANFARMKEHHNDSHIQPEELLSPYLSFARKNGNTAFVAELSALLHPTPSPLVIPARF